MTDKKTSYKFTYTTNSEDQDEVILFSTSMKEAQNIFYDTLDEELPDGAESFVSLDSIKFKNEQGEVIEVTEPSLLNM